MSFKFLFYVGYIVTKINYLYSLMFVFIFILNHNKSKFFSYPKPRLSVWECLFMPRYKT